MASFWLFYYQLWTYFTPCSSVSILNFEHVIARRVNEIKTELLTLFWYLLQWTMKRFNRISYSLHCWLWIFTYVFWKGILHPKLNPAGIYLFKVNIGNTFNFNSQWNLFKVGDEDTTSLTSFWCLYCQLWTDCSLVSMTDFEQVNAGCYWNVSEKLLKYNAVNCDYKK